MKKRWIYLSAVLLLFGVCAARPLIGATAPSDPVDTSRECVLNVSPVDASDPEKAEYLEDMKKAHITLELYKVAGAKKLEGYNAYQYQFEPESAYKGLDISDYSRLQELTASDWEALAQEAARITLAPDTALRPAASGSVDNAGKAVLSGSDVRGGLYLLVARDANLTKDKYVKTVKVEASGGEDTAEQEKLVTIANSDQYEYLFEPQLVALPTKEADTDGAVSTANPGPWLYEADIYLKSGREPRYAPLEIVKTLRGYETAEGTANPVTFVFSVVATREGEANPVYDEVASLTFTGPGTESVRLERIPAQSTVTVTEIYNGFAYSQMVPSDDGPIVLDNISADPDAENRAAFENVYNHKRTHGHGINNRFEYDEEAGEWEWTREPAPSGGQEGE